MNNSCQKIYSNLTLKEKKAFHDLKNNQSIVIKPCKKGRGICIMNTRDYLSHKDTNLQDHNTYKSLTHNLKKAKSMMFALSYTICIHNTYRPGHNEIPITSKNTSTPLFCGPLKLNKQDYPLHPTASSLWSKYFSSYIIYFIHFTHKRHKHFLNIIEKLLSFLPNAFLVAADVTSP